MCIYIYTERERDIDIYIYIYIYTYTCIHYGGSVQASSRPATRARGPAACHERLAEYC